MTDVLLVTSSVRMLNWVHGNTSNSWEVVSLSLVLVPGSVGLEERLIGSLSSSNNSNHSSALAHNGLSGSRWKSDSGLFQVIRVSDDDSGSTGSSGELSSISGLALAVGHNGTLWHGVDWKNISN